MSLMAPLLSQDGSSCSNTWWMPANQHYPPTHPSGSQSYNSFSTDTTSCVLTHHNWMFDRLLVSSSSPSDRAMFAMVGQHRMGNGTFAPCCIKVLIFLKLKDLVAKCRRTSWGLRMGGVGCQLLIMQTFPRSRCIFTPAVRILWRYAGLYKHAVQSSNMSQTDFKAKKILSELFSWNYLRCQNLRNFCRFDTFKSHVIITCRIKCKRLVAIRASCGHTCVL